MVDRDVDRRFHERRRRDKWGRRFERGMLGVLLALYVLGFHSQSTVQDRINESRASAVRVICGRSNQQTMALRRLIVQGAVGSRVFERFYREVGAPPFKVRVAQARASALSVPVMDCEELARQVKAAKGSVKP